MSSPVLLTVLKHMLNKARERMLPDGPFYQVRYLSVPLWKPWRDY
jgi:hypothetical protein